MGFNSGFKGLKNVGKLLHVYLPNKKEETNGSSARHRTVQYSTVQYMVLVVSDG